MSMKVTKEEFLGVKNWTGTHDLQLEEDVRQFFLEKHPELFKVEYLGEWKDDDGRD